MSFTDSFAGGQEDYFDLPETKVKRPRAPFEILILGLIFIIGLLLARFLGPQSWELDLLANAAFWVASMVAFLVPYAMFSEINLVRQLNPDYRSNKESAKRLVFIFVLFGFLVSISQMLFVSSLLARLLNVD